MVNQTNNTIRDERTYGINGNRHQQRIFYVEAGLVPNGDTIEVLHFDYANEGPFPPTSVNVYTHDGGLVFDFTAASTDAAGDTMVLEAYNLRRQDIRLQKDMDPGPPNYEEIIHVLADTVTDGAITAAEAAVSWNADENAASWAYAVATTATELTLFPLGMQSHIRQGSGSTATNLMGKNTTPALTNDKRTFTQQDMVAAAWSWTYLEGNVVITNNTGGDVANVVAAVQYF